MSEVWNVNINVRAVLLVESVTCIKVVTLTLFWVYSGFALLGCNCVFLKAAVYQGRNRSGAALTQHSAFTLTSLLPCDPFFTSMFINFLLPNYMFRKRNTVVILHAAWHSFVVHHKKWQGLKSFFAAIPEKKHYLFFLVFFTLNPYYFFHYHKPFVWKNHVKGPFRML